MNATLIDLDVMEKDFVKAARRPFGAAAPALAEAPVAGSMPNCSEEWAVIFKLVLRDETKSILARGRLFCIAKIHLQSIRGEWSRIWALKNKSDRPGRTKRTGDKYALIGEEFGFANEKISSHLGDHLPATVEGLFFLAQLGQEQVLQLIAADRIHDRLTIPKCRALRNEIRPDLNKKRAFNRQRWLSRHNRVMEQQHTEGKRQDWLAAILNLEQHLDILRAKVSALGETETALLPQLASQSQHQKAA